MESKNYQFEYMEELLLRYLKGLANDDERAEVRKWINEKPEHKKYFDSLKDIFIVTGASFDIKKYNKTEGWKRVESGYYKEMYKKVLKQSNNKLQPIVRIAVSIAAALVIAFLSGVVVKSYIINKYSVNKIVYNEVTVPLGAKSQVTLSDGSKVWLNAGSKLRYPLQFGEMDREVFLEGEGYFDVAHDKNKRFLVKTSEVTIKVYGTQFNVKAYPEENRIITTLVNGSVVVEANNGNKSKTYLKPNETAIFFKSQHSFSQNQNINKQPASKIIPIQTSKLIITPQRNTNLVTSWKDSLWIIEGDGLGQLAVMLERRYNVKIVFTNDELKNYKFTGILANETFEQVMKIIQISAPIKFRLDHNLVTISEDKIYKIKYDNLINKTN